MQERKSNTYYFETTEFREVHGELLSLEQMAVVAGVQTTLLKTMVIRELLRPEETEPEIRLHIGNLSRIRKILRLHFDLGVGWSSMDLVLDLLDRIDSLEEKLRIQKES